MIIVYLNCNWEKISCGGKNWLKEIYLYKIVVVVLSVWEMCVRLDTDGKMIHTEPNLKIIERRNDVSLVLSRNKYSICSCVSHFVVIFCSSLVSFSFVSFRSEMNIQNYWYGILSELVGPRAHRLVCNVFRIRCMK